ncbi:mutt/nudix family protein-like protein [Lotmaria passim]
MEKVLSKSSLLSFPLADVAVRRYEKERGEAGFIARRAVPAAKPCAVVCKDNGSGILLNGGPTCWLHPILLHGGSSFLRVPITNAAFVGEDTTRPRNVFVVGAQEVEPDYAAHREWASPMSVLASLNPTEQSLLGLALSMQQWSTLNAFCTRCGAAMHSTDFGLTRDCTSCKHRIYPSVVPAMIVAVLDGKGNVIMSERRQRGTSAPSNKPRLTILAGFVAQGESMEETVVREVMEETGARVTSLRYVGSQPWPKPYELMTCYYAVAEDSPNLKAEEDELMQVRWVSKKDVALMLAGKHREFVTSPPNTATFPLLEAWVSGRIDNRGQPTSRF